MSLLFGVILDPTLIEEKMVELIMSRILYNI